MNKLNQTKSDALTKVQMDNACPLLPIVQKCSQHLAETNSTILH